MTTEQEMLLNLYESLKTKRLVRFQKQARESAVALYKETKDPIAAINRGILTAELLKEYNS